MQYDPELSAQQTDALLKYNPTVPTCQYTDLSAVCSTTLSWTASRQMNRCTTIPECLPASILTSVPCAVRP